jgi:molybdopterin converting factor small subunit
MIRGFGPVRDLLGSEMVELEIKEDQTLVDTIDSILEEHSGLRKIILDSCTGKPKTSVKFLLNKMSVELPRDAERRVEEGDVLAILPPVGGG